MSAVGITPSEIARRIWGTAKDKRGYDVARNRDRIGHYLAGTSYPTEVNLQKLADVLNMPIETLRVGAQERSPTGRPQQQIGPSGRASPLPDMSATGLLQTSMPTAPAPSRLARFQADRMISPELAITITQMILKEDQHRTREDAAALDEGADKTASNNLGKIVGGTEHSQP